ncbi:MAG: type 1 periplasmic binding fold superfamily protein [Flavobacteriaceae bacterium]|nr:type 1 periplasmic binding fold superfamily protein [Flavobacteriaceae bacterium]
MKNYKLLSLIFLAFVVFTACSDDDTPDPVNEEEVITTLTVTLDPVGGGTSIELKSQDLDGDGPNDPVVTVSGPLANGVTYNGSIKLLNETESPAEDITLEVEAEDDEHQFFYTIGGGLDVTTTYTNFDGNSNPLGTEFDLTAGAASSGTLTFTLRHEPTKPNTGLGDAGGETDIAVTFDVTVQ